MRVVKSSNEFFDILDKIGNGKYITIGYVTGANLNVPTIKKKNPLTNRMKGYPDFSAFADEGEDEIGALVKISSYNMRYLNRSTVGKKYGEYKDAANAIRGEYGLEPIGSKESYKQGTDWSPNGPELYKGQNADLQSHSYNPQNIHGVSPKGIVYAVNKEGHIMKELSTAQVKPYLKSKRETDGVSALRKMGVEEERIKQYIEKINGLKFKYINFEANSILWIAATVNGEKIVYINDNLQRAVDGINIRPEDFRAIARERYKIDLGSLHESRKTKKILRLTESELMGIVKESVISLLKEERGGNTHESFNNNQNYTHFAVNKKTGKIVNGWDYADEDPEDLRLFKKDYFINDLLDYELNPKEYKVLTAKSLIRMGIDPNDNNNWANR